MEFGEFFLFAGGNDEMFGSESVLDGVTGGAGFAFDGARTGRQGCVVGVGSRPGGCSHENVLWEIWKRGPLPCSY